MFPRLGERWSRYPRAETKKNRALWPAGSGRPLLASCGLPLRTQLPMHAAVSATGHPPMHAAVSATGADSMLLVDRGMGRDNRQRVGTCCHLLLMGRAAGHTPSKAISRKMNDGFALPYFSRRYLHTRMQTVSPHTHAHGISTHARTHSSPVLRPPPPPTQTSRTASFSPFGLVHVMFHQFTATHGSWQTQHLSISTAGMLWRVGCRRGCRLYSNKINVLYLYCKKKGATVPHQLP